jgi:eukaryotic-like serine/threonine-protein kinase
MTRRILSASIETLPVARRLLHEVVHRWQAGEAPNARQVIEQHPEFANVKSVVIDLAYEEYCLRVEKGEAVDRDQFCGQFPEFSTSLCRRLEVHDFFQSEQELSSLIKASMRPNFSAGCGIATLCLSIRSSTTSRADYPPS